MTDNNRLPGDIKDLLPWLNVVRRLRSVSITSGYAVLGIRVIVDDHGQPVQWTAPTVTLLEPKNNGHAVDMLLATLVME